MLWPIYDGLNSHVDTGKPLTMAHIGRVPLGVVGVARDRAVSLGCRRRDGRTVARRRHTASTGRIAVMPIRLLVQVHGMIAVMERAGPRVRACSLRTAVGSIEVIYWSQTNARDAAVVVIPME